MSCSIGCRNVCFKKRTEKYPIHKDKPFIQDYSIKFNHETKDAELKKVVSDRNGYIQVLSSKGLVRIRAGQFLFPGTLVKSGSIGEPEINERMKE